ncbi:MAG: diacylglyceryl transferase [Planctomycetaceae bacterium]|jgi:prolipoprotein diacylglyceryltransferase|nr:diacylglyceryl transferase [Planctomycetaceae bacterium]MDP7278013.1 prolipoprotein diacylglyceryl transferase [Planctomycetaceae bacterium]
MSGRFTYAAIMLAAVAVAAWLSRDSQARLGLSFHQRVMVGLGAFSGGFLAAKLPFVLVYVVDGDWAALLSGRALLADGKTIMLGLVGGYVGVELAKWWSGVRVSTGDSFAVSVPVAVAIGRLACFTNGCCHGIATSAPWGIDFGDGVSRHPTQLYETAFHLACGVALAVMRRDGLLRGQLIKLYLLLYFVFRFATEFLRPEVRLWGGWTGYQWAALLLVPIFTALWWHDARTGRGRFDAVG